MLFIDQEVIGKEIAEALTKLVIEKPGITKVDGNEQIEQPLNFTTKLALSKRVKQRLVAVVSHFQL
jgi:hypothetical protein